MKAFFLKYKHYFFIFIIGVLWLSFFNELMQISKQNNICNDCDNYRESASFLYNNFKAHYFRPIGMAIIIGLPYLFGGTDKSIYIFGLIINILAWLGSASLIYSLLKKQVKANKALFFTLIFYSILGSLFINFKLLTESIFTFLILSIFYFIEKYYRNKSVHYLNISISILLFSILVKPSIKFLAIIFCIYFGKTIIKNYLDKSILLIWMSISLIAFQYIKMKREYGNYTLTYIDSVTYYNYLGSKAFYYKTNDTLNQTTNKRAFLLEKHTFPEQKKIATEDLLNQIKNNKINLIRAYISDLSENTKTPSSSIYQWENIKNSTYFDIVKEWIQITSKYQNRFFTLVGFILAVYYFFKSYKKNTLDILMSFYIIYTIFISGISCSQGDRFHIVFFPFVIIFLAKFCEEKFQNKPTNYSK